MGIDAKLLIRKRGSKPTEDKISEWSWNLSRAIGAKNFFVQDGLLNADYQERVKKWHKDFDSHSLCSEFEINREVHKDIIADIGRAPEQRRRAIELTNYLYPLEEEEASAPYREPGKCYMQDGDTIWAAEDEWLLEVNLWTRYYGEGYERGDILTLCAIAEWIEVNIPNCEVWYGGDSSGVCAKPFNEDRRIELRRHLYSNSGKEYFDSYPEASPDPCSLCVPSGSRFSQYGWGKHGNYVAVHCGGCGKSFISEDAGNTWKKRESND